MKKLWPKQNRYKFSFVFFGISFVFLKMDGHPTIMFRMVWHFLWWIFGSIPSSVQSSRILAQKGDFMGHPNHYTTCKTILSLIWSTLIFLRSLLGFNLCDGWSTLHFWSYLNKMKILCRICALVQKFNEKISKFSLYFSIFWTFWASTE